MARRALARRAPNVYLMGGPRRARRTVTRYVRRAGRAGRRALPTVGVALGGIVAGYLDGRGTFDSIPEFGGMSRMTTIGVLGYGITRFAKDQRVRAAGLAMLGAAAYDWGRAQGLESQSEGGSRRVQP